MDLKGFRNMRTIVAAGAGLRQIETHSQQQIRSRFAQIDEAADFERRAAEGKHED